MYSPLSDNWDLAIRSGNPRITIADLYYDPSSSDPVITDLPVVDYSIKVDRRAANRRTGSCTIASEELLNELRTAPGVSPLEPYGSEIRIRSGVVHADGSTELVPIGVFSIETLGWSESDSEMDFELFDRSRIFERAQFRIPFPAGGWSSIDLINYLFETIAPWIVVNIDADVEDIILPGGNSYTGPVLTVLHDLTEAVGAEFYFNTAGEAVIRNVPFVDQSTTASMADWEVDTGASGVLIEANHSITRTDTVNIVHVYGAASEGSALPWASAADDDPASPTYYAGPFGRADLSIEKQELTTSAQCLSAAQAILFNSKGLPTSIALEALSNPALEEGDIIVVRFEDDSEEVHLVDGMTLDPSGSMPINTRSQQRIV